MRVAVLVESSWDAASIEFDRGRLDWDRAVLQPGPGSLESVELGLGLGVVTVYSAGEAGEPVLRAALAMGAERAFRGSSLEAVAAHAAGAGFDLFLTPARSGDQGPSPSGPYLAGLLDLPQATAVEYLEVEAGARTAAVRSRLDRGRRAELRLDLPAVIAVEPGLAVPREGSPAAVIAAQTAALEVLPAQPAAVDMAVLLGHRPPRPPPPRQHPPAPGLSAEARLAAVAGGEMRAARELVTGTAEEVAARIEAFLAERGLL